MSIWNGLVKHIANAFHVSYERQVLPMPTKLARPVPSPETMCPNTTAS